MLAQLPNQLLELLHIGQGAKSQAVLLHTGDAKTVGGGPCGDHQPAEMQLAACLGFNRFGGAIDAADPVLQPGHAFAR